MSRYIQLYLLFFMANDDDRLDVMIYKCLQPDNELSQ